MAPDGTSHDLPRRRGLMLILSSPSGAGKTTLTRMLLQNKDIDLTLSVSVTDAAASIERGRWAALSFYRPGPVPRLARPRRPVGMGGSAWQFLRDTEGAGRDTVALRTGRAVRHRLSGHAADQVLRARRRGYHLHSPAIDARVAGPPRTSSRGQARRDRPPARGGAQRDHPLEALRLRLDQRRSATDARRRPVDPRRRATETGAHRDGCRRVRRQARGPSDDKRPTADHRSSVAVSTILARAAKSAIDSVSARAVPSRPAFDNKAPTADGPSRPAMAFSDCRSILRRCPKAAAVTRGQRSRRAIQRRGTRHQFDDARDNLGGVARRPTERHRRGSARSFASRRGTANRP